MIREAISTVNSFFALTLIAVCLWLMGGFDRDNHPW
jgi:hypothetical protein